MLDGQRQRLGVPGSEVGPGNIQIKTRNRPHRVHDVATQLKLENISDHTSSAIISMTRRLGTRQGKGLAHGYAAKLKREMGPEFPATDHPNCLLF